MCRCLTRLIKQGRKGLAPIHLRRLQVYSLKLFSGFGNKDGKTYLTRAVAQSGTSHQQKAAKVERTAKKSRVQAREARAAVEENKKAQLERDKQLSEQQNKRRWRKNIKPVKQLIEMNRITIANGDIGFNFTDGNLIKKILSISSRKRS